MAKIKFKFNLSKDLDQRGIWSYSSYLPFVPDSFKLSLGEGNTPEISWDGKIILKREDLNPTGSLKDRGMAFLISKMSSLGERHFVLSSSGNAAISAAAYCRLAKMDLHVFVSLNIDKEKLKELQKQKIKLSFSQRPLSDSLKFSKKNQWFNLRPSALEFGREGYQTIAFEIITNQGMVDDIFLPVSSGVALTGIARGFKKFGFLPHLHLCQSTAVHPLASIFDRDFCPEKKSLATSLVAKTTPLKEEVLKLVKESGGSGWVISNQEISETKKKLEMGNIFTSPEGALALASIGKARNRGWNLGKTICLLTGRRYEDIKNLK